ncbi:ADP-ribosylglycohydrolase family protein [Endozoicomonas gorgoniicola]|uniref:ADP-ribosylglycohydrolase family protein n=1 Tax=Endozoicomonas gorgoniicola TaxID=1234144 RepID=A0ABT3MT06_9GAMM|nr:ADP-ribosylglycohydrolase family protein [Endozoicomonas gorgoniicola]MCW7552519.1 ADP-ribosylglycohydrolase family protein [Endozoicomonas gorgoniicola]
MLNASTFFIASLLITSMPVFAAPPTNAELALAGTGIGDSRGERNYHKEPRHMKPEECLCTDDTQKAAAIFAYFSGSLSGCYTKKSKGVDRVRMARIQCFSEFPKKQRFGLDMAGHPDVNLRGYGPGHATLLKKFYKKFDSGDKMSPADVLTLSSKSVGGKTGSWGNGGCMGIAPIVGIIDTNPYISDERFVHLVRQTVEVSHNHPHAISAAVAIALAARSSIEYRTSDPASRPSHRDFAFATLRRIRQYATDNTFLKCLKIVERHIGSSSHVEVMSELNSLLPTSARVGSSHNEQTRILVGLWGPSSAAAVLHFFFTDTESQQELLQLVKQFTHDQDTIGAMLMALSVLREGGFRRNEFDVNELQGLLDYFPPWVNINRNAHDYLIDNNPTSDSNDTVNTIAATDTCNCTGACGCANWNRSLSE